jgi:flagellar FliJ protein
VARQFHFSLETLLRVRDIREREAKRKVGLKQAEIARLDQLNRQTTEEIATRQTSLRQHQRGTFTPEELVRERAWIAYLRRTIVERQARRGELVTELEELRNAWHQARMRKRIIEKLRERRWEQYAKERRRGEQDEADELARHLHAHGIAT